MYSCYHLFIFDMSHETCLSIKANSKDDFELLFLFELLVLTLAQFVFLLIDTSDELNSSGTNEKTNVTKI